MSIFGKTLVFMCLLHTLTFITSTLVNNTSHTINKVTDVNETLTVNNNRDGLSILTEGGDTVQAAVSFNKTSSTKATKVSSTTSSSKISSSSTTAALLSLADIEKSILFDNKTSDRKKISARKGVNITEIEIKKPTVTTSSEDKPYAQSKINSSSSQSLPKVPNIKMLSGNTQNTQKYIVPIVIVILSVPFVAVLISVLYKRGTEWWKYRHYRRMDFLINGIYDN